MTTSPRVSVIIPCYNAHAYLGETLASIRNQTFKDLEIVIIDDGSTNPDTLAFLAALPADIRQVRQENRGLPGARNSGFRHALGEYVLPLDCDDWLDPGFLEQTLATLEATPGAAYAFAHMALEGELHGVLRKSYNFFEQLFFNQLPYCLLMPKRLWEEVGGYDETMRKGYEDWEFNIRLGGRGHFGVVCPQPLFHYRILSGGMLKSISNKYHAQLWSMIQQRNSQVYSPFGLYQAWKVWHARPSSYPPVMLIGWLLVHRLLPARACNALLAFLLPKFSHARRVARSEATLS
jgi:glycosyltransferase involved in cell wall biosynthesis